MAKQSSSKSQAKKKTGVAIGEDLSLEEAEEAMLQLKARIEKAKKQEKQKKKKASLQAEADAEQNYQKQAQARSNQPPAAATPVKQTTKKATSRGTQSSAPRRRTGRTGDDDAYSVIFEDVEDDFVPEGRPEVSGNDQTPSPGAERRQKRKGRAESDGEGGSDGEGPSPKSTPTAAKKRKGASAAAVTVADAAEPLRKKLPARRGDKHTISDPADESDKSDGDEEEEEERPIGEHTPYKRVINAKDEKKPRVKDFSPTSKTLANNVRKDYTILICTVNAFPSDDNANDMVDELFVETTASATQGSKIARRVERYAADNEYQSDIQLVGQNVDAGFRGRVVATVQPLVDRKYDFDDEDSSHDSRKADAAALVKQGAFAYRDWKTRKGYLMNPLIWRLLAKQFLAKRGKKRKAYIQPGPDMAAFKEMGNELIAFLLTTIHCAIDGWSSGAFDKPEFSKTDYEGKYLAHLSTIRTVARGNPNYMAKVRKTIWDEACKLAGLSTSIEVEEDISSEVYITAEELNGLDDDEV